MAAKLTANPNPVLVDGPGGTGTTTIAWDTDGDFPGRVYLSVNGAAPTLFGGGNAGTRTGTKVQSVKLGNTYAFTLRRVSNNAVLAVRTVTVADLQQKLVDMAVAGLALQDRFDPPQWIGALQVDPSVDMVRVSFKTGRPTIPLVEVETPDGQVLARWWPLLGGLRTRHVGVLGQSDPLPQGTTLRVRITVPGRPPMMGKAKDVVRTAEFRTGTRLVDVSFDTLTVRNDGDPGIKGAGDFEFEFVAGDAQGSVDFFAPDLEQDISAGDPPVLLDRGISLPSGPRQVYLRVSGADHDIEFPWGGLEAAGKLGFRGVGSGATSTKLTEGAWVANVFDVSNTGLGFTTIPFALRTGDFAVAFTVDGRIMTIVRPGKGVFTPKLDLGSNLGTTVLGVAGAKGAVGGGKDKSGMMVALAADGAVCVTKWTEREAPSQQDWERMAPSPGGPVTALLGGDGEPVLLALDDAGEAVVWRSTRRSGSWVRLGARFSRPLVAVAGRGAHIGVWGVDAAGRVRHCNIDREARDAAVWTTVAEGILGGLLAVPVESGIAFFALDREGGVVHALSAPRGQRIELGRIGWPRAAWVAAAPAPAEAGGLLVSALTDERILHVLHWRDHPQGEPARRWKNRGPIDEVLPLLPLTTPRIDEPECAARELESGITPPTGRSAGRAAQRAEP